MAERTTWLWPLAYLATPYSRYPAGLDAAFQDAARMAAKLLVAGIRVYSPIAHCHALAMFGELDPLDLNLWLNFDSVMMDKADVLIAAHLPSWDSSTGIAHEIAAFEKAGKPIYDLDPDDMSLVRRK